MFTDVIRHHDQGNLSMKEFIGAYVSEAESLSIMAGSTAAGRQAQC